MAADKKRGTQTVWDMVLSLAVILLAAGGIYYLFIPHDEDRDPVRPVNYEVDVNSARRAAPYPIAAPEGLPKQWRATSVRYEGSSEYGSRWHLGFMAPGDEYAAVEQSDARPAAYIAKVSQGAERTGRTQRINGETWTRYEGTKYDALVREEPGVTTVVTGTASFGQLTKLADSLVAERPESSSPTPASPSSAQATPSASPGDR